MVLLAERSYRIGELGRSGIGEGSDPHRPDDDHRLGRDGQVRLDPRAGEGQREGGMRVAGRYRFVVFGIDSQVHEKLARRLQCSLEDPALHIDLHQHLGLEEGFADARGCRPYGAISDSDGYISVIGRHEAFVSNLVFPISQTRDLASSSPQYSFLSILCLP